MPSFTKVATGAIVPSSFVKLASTDGKVTQCGAGDEIYGISHPGKRFAPWAPLDDGNLAIAGESLAIYGPPEKDVLLRLGGTVTPGQRLKSDASGFGVATTADGDEYGAIAMVNGVSGQLILVQCVGPAQRGA